MKPPQEPSLIRRMIAARVKQMAAKGPVLTASLVRIAKHCGRAGCHCQPAAKGGRDEKHVGNYVTYKEAGKTRTVYVPLSQLEEVRAWHEEAQRMRRLMQECSQLCLAWIRRQAQIKRETASRRTPSPRSSSRR